MEQVNLDKKTSKAQSILIAYIRGTVVIRKIKKSAAFWERNLAELQAKLNRRFAKGYWGKAD